MKEFYFRKFIFYGKPYSFKARADNIKDALTKAVNFGMKKHNLPNEYFGEQYQMAKENLEKGYNVVEIVAKINQGEFNFEQKFEEIYKGLINEEIRGEWWIDDGGDVWFADGDIGDMDHAGMVIERITGEILSYFNIDTDEIIGMENVDTNEIKEYLLDDIPDNEHDDFIEKWDNDKIQVMIDALKEMGCENAEQKMEVALDQLDPRDYGLAYLGWKRVHGNWIQTYQLTQQDLNIIVRGAYAILDETGKTHHDEEYKETFNIEVSKSGRVFRDIPWEVLEKKRLRDLLEYRGDF